MDRREGPPDQRDRPPSEGCWLCIYVRGGLDAFQELVEQNAVGKRGYLRDLAVTHLHEEGIGVLVGLPARAMPRPSHRTITVFPSACTERMFVGRNRWETWKRAPKGLANSSRYS